MCTGEATWALRGTDLLAFGALRGKPRSFFILAGEGHGVFLEIVHVWSFRFLPSVQRGPFLDSPASHLKSPMP